jgi:hypothetical protein
MTAHDIAVLVGVDQFNDINFPPLHFCKNDVDGMARVLGDPEISGFEIIRLSNKRHDEVLETLERTVANLVPGDKFLFYFAGHGRRSQFGRLYLVATDTKVDALRATGILVDNALDIIRESRCTHRALILDCCHSGAVGESFRGGDVKSELDNLAQRNSGTYILTASTAIELAEERESAVGDGTTGNGIFTKYFIEALDTGNASSSGSEDVTLDAVYDYVHQRVSPQRPQRFIIGGIGSFVVGRSVAAHWERRRNDLKKRFGELHYANNISDDHYISVLKILRTSWSALQPDQKAIARMGLDVLDGKMSDLEFFSQLKALSVTTRLSKPPPVSPDASHRAPEPAPVSPDASCLTPGTPPVSPDASRSGLRSDLAMRKGWRAPIFVVPTVVATIELVLYGTGIEALGQIGFYRPVPGLTFALLFALILWGYAQFDAKRSLFTAAALWALWEIIYVISHFIPSLITSSVSSEARRPLLILYYFVSWTAFGAAAMGVTARVYPVFRAIRFWLIVILPYAAISTLIATVANELSAESRSSVLFFGAICRHVFLLTCLACWFSRTTPLRGTSGSDLTPHKLR